MSNIEQALERLQIKFQRDAEHIPRSITSLLYPQFNQAIPSMAILQLKINPGQQEVLTLPKGTQLIGANPKSRDIKLQLAYATQLLPIAIKELQYCPGHIGAQLTMKLQAINKETTYPANKKIKLRIFLNMPWPEVLLLYNAFDQHLETITICSDDKLAELNANALQGLGSKREHAMLDQSRLSYDPCILWQEYLLFPQKFLCYDLEIPPEELSRINHRTFDLSFIFNNFSDKLAARVDNDSILLNCAPIINSSNQQAQAFPYEENKINFPIKVIPGSIEPQSEIIQLTNIKITNHANTQAIPAYAIYTDPAEPSVEEYFSWHAYYENDHHIELQPNMPTNNQYIVHPEVLVCDASLPAAFDKAAWQIALRDADYHLDATLELITDFTKFHSRQELTNWQLILQSKSDLNNLWELLKAYNHQEIQLLQQIFAQVSIEPKLSLDPKHLFVYETDAHQLLIPDSIDLSRMSLAIRIYSKYQKQSALTPRHIQITAFNKQGEAWQCHKHNI